MTSGFYGTGPDGCSTLSQSHSIQHCPISRRRIGMRMKKFVKRVTVLEKREGQVGLVGEERKDGSDPGEMFLTILLKY